MLLLHEVRNTIHRAEFPQNNHEFGRLKEVQSSGAFVEVSLPADNLAVLLAAASRCGSLERWGLVKQAGGILLEPYTFSSSLVEECFRLMDKIAEATTLSGLYPSEEIIPVSPTAPPRDRKWNHARKIIALLG
jgi:hypothetical protein